MFIYDLSIFLTSTAFVDTNAKYGIPLLRYTVFFENYPLGYDPKGWAFIFGTGITNRTRTDLNATVRGTVAADGSTEAILN